jgi:hypothetical protein
MNRRPQPSRYFFEQASLQQRLGQRLLELCRHARQFRDLVTAGLTSGIARRAFLASLRNPLRSAVERVLVDAFFATGRGNTGSAPKPFQRDA